MENATNRRIAERRFSEERRARLEWALANVPDRRTADRRREAQRKADSAFVNIWLATFDAARGVSANG